MEKEIRNSFAEPFVPENVLSPEIDQLPALEHGSPILGTLENQPNKSQQEFNQSHNAVIEQNIQQRAIYKPLPTPPSQGRPIQMGGAIPLYAGDVFVGYGTGATQPRPNRLPMNPQFYARPRPGGPMYARPSDEYIPLGMQYRPRPPPEPMQNGNSPQFVQRPPQMIPIRPHPNQMGGRPFPRPIRPILKPFYRPIMMNDNMYQSQPPPSEGSATSSSRPGSPEKRKNSIGSDFADPRKHPASLYSNPGNSGHRLPMGARPPPSYLLYPVEVDPKLNHGAIPVAPGRRSYEHLQAADLDRRNSLDSRELNIRNYNPEDSENDSESDVRSSQASLQLDDQRPTFLTISRQKRQQQPQMSPEQELEAKRRAAAESNDPKIQFEYAKACLEIGDDNVDEGFLLLKKLASSGYPEAHYFLGDAFADDGKHSMAYSQYFMAAKRGFAPACHAIASCAENGRGCKKSNRLALEMYTKAATAGNLNSMYRLGLAELNGELGLRPDIVKAVKWFKRACAVPNRDHPEPLFELSKIYEAGVPPYIVQDFAYARGVLLEAADFGYPPAIYKLGYCYEHGLMGMDVNPAESIRLYTAAIRANYIEALLGMAGWHMTGAENLMEKNEVLAYNLVKEAASKGLPRAQYTLGYFHEEGIGCTRDIEAALVFYGMAAEQGDERAARRLNKQNEKGKSKQKKKSGSIFGFFRGSN